jgi:hypothetical protein
MTDIVGTWRLVRALALDGDGEELPVPYGGQGRAALFSALMAAWLS